MNKKHFSAKVLLSFLVALMFLGTVCVFASAADKYTNKNLAYGEIVPTDSKLMAQKYSYSFYGDKGDMYFMRMSKGVKNAYFSIEIYSDSKYQTQIRSYSKAYDTAAGNKSLKVTWEFKNTTSGTYYGKCYSYALDSNGNKTIDSSSLKTFKIYVDRISQRAVSYKKLINTANGPQISWTSVPTATKYYVYRRASSEKNWSLITTLGATAVSYTDSTAKSGTTYSYAVRCSYNNLKSPYKGGLSILCLSMPKISVEGTGSAGNTQIKWNAINGAKGYYIYRKGGNLSSSSWKLIATIKNGKTTSYIDKNAKSSDWRYTYTVKAYNGNTVSGYNTTGVNFNYIAAPKLSKAYSYTNGMRIEWSASDPNIVCYRVYRKNANSWKYLGQTKNKYFIDTTAASSSTYTYTVKALSSTNAGAFNSSGITAKFIATPKLNALTYNASNNSVVSWNSVKGAAGYKVYRKIGNASSWTLIKTINSAKTLKFYDTCAKTSSTKYTYTVRAFDSKKITGWFESPGTYATFLSMPDFKSEQISSTDNALCIKTSWNAVKGATGYNVYRRIPGTTWAALVRGTTDLYYLDTTVESGIKYEYAVRAVNTAGNMSSYYTKTAIAVTIPDLDSVVVTEDGVKLTWNALQNATSYNIYRKADGVDTWEKTATVETNEYTDTSEEGKTQPYYYTVSAVFGDTESAVNDGIPNFTEAQISATFVPATDDKAPYIDVTVTCDGAEALEIYKSVNGEEPILLDNITASFEDTQIEEGNTYTYTVKAMATEKVTYTTSAVAKYPHPPLDAPVITDITGDYNGGLPTVTLTWNEVAFADEYTVLKLSSDGNWIETGTVKAETESAEAQEETASAVYTFTDTDVNAEVTYTYKVKAVATLSERDSSESEAAQTTVYTPLESVTGLKTVSDKSADGSLNVTVSWDTTQYAQNYKVYIKTDNSDWREAGDGIVGDGNPYFTVKVNINTNYTFKVVASAPNRGTVSNEISFTWSQDLTPADPESETYLDTLSDGTFVSGNYIVTDVLEIDDFGTIATAKEGYTLQIQAASGDLYGTGSVITVAKDGEQTAVYMLIIKGDVTGDGICDIQDISEVEKFVNGNTTAKEIYIFAADMNGDGIITATDYDLIAAKI